VTPGGLAAQPILLVPTLRVGTSGFFAAPRRDGSNRNSLHLDSGSFAPQSGGVPTFHASVGRDTALTRCGAGLAGAVRVSIIVSSERPAGEQEVPMRTAIVIPAATHPPGSR